jgi:broad specificity phosphatase PhoE
MKAAFNFHFLAAKSPRLSCRFGTAHSLTSITFISISTPQPLEPKINAMHLFLIRHGETEHNVAGLLAGVTDSRLTNHGLLQTKRLGQYLTATRKLRFTHLFASDLQRAWMTADEIRKAQEAHSRQELRPAIVKLDLLREQDFGSLELVSWASKRASDAVDPTKPGFKDKETTDSMFKRANQFIDDYLAPLWALDDADDICVAIVSHGLFLSTLWRSLLLRFETANTHLGPEVGPVSPSRPLEYIGAWSNTGYLEVDVKPAASLSAASLRQPAATGMPGTFPSHSIRVLAINGRDHLLNLQRTRGGVGSAAHDARQKPIDGFFKRPSTEDSVG